MARISINELTTYRWLFEVDIQNYERAGVDGIAVWRQKLSDFGEEKGVELLSESALEVSSLLWAGGFTGSDGRTYRESVNDAIEAVKLSRDLKAGCLIVYSGARARHTRNHARRLFRSALKQILPFAEEHGVTLAIEPMHEGCAMDWTFLNGLDEALDWITGIGSSHLKLVFDIYHLGHDQGILKRIPELIPHIAIVQVGDCRQPPRGEQNRCRLGEGMLPLQDFITALIDEGYDGFFDIELMGEDLDNPDYAELIDHSLRQVRQYTA